MNTTAVVKQENAGVPSLAMGDGELIGVLRNSLYPGAADDSIKLVIGYCKASGLDPMQKPVHIVPMWDKKAGMMRDVIMPGIGLYRTQAARSGEYAGVTEPEFGPDVTESVGGQSITFPAWCKVTVKRLLKNGDIAEFTATERWKENYAASGGKEKSVAPNAMWTKRPYAQLAKCAEAQALRKAFPEFGSQPTADEMDGKEIDMGSADRIPVMQPKELPVYHGDAFAKNLPTWKKLIQDGKKTPEQIIATVNSKALLTDAQKESIMDIANIPQEQSGRISEYDALLKRLKEATDPDVLDADATLIETFSDQAHKDKLTSAYRQRREELGQ